MPPATAVSGGVAPEDDVRSPSGPIVVLARRGRGTRYLFAETPLEVLEAAYGRIRAESKSEVVGRLKDESPALFERVVIELLVKMLYGGS